MTNLPQLGYVFLDESLISRALTHKSFSNEKGLDLEANNEKLEFLGDAVLDLVLSDLLMKRFPQDSEGNLSKKRASLVNETTLAQIGKDLCLHEFVKMGKGEMLSSGPLKPRLLASVYEAVLGAIYLEAGFEVVKQTAEKHFDSILVQMNPEESFLLDFKTRLQELAQAEFKATPLYTLIAETGPSHLPVFQVQVQISQSIVAQGSGRSKKLAEQDAAKVAIESWSAVIQQMKGGQGV